MTEHPTEDSSETGEQLRDQAIEDVARGEEAWIDRVLGMIRAISSGNTFSTDRLWSEVAAAKLTTHEPRVMGAAIKLAKQLGLIEATGIYEKSCRPKCHARPVMIWRRK